MSVAILPNVNSTKQNRVVKQVISVCFPHHKVDEQPNKKTEKYLPFPKRKRKRRQECCDYFEKCITIGCVFTRLGNIGFSERQTDPGKPDAKSLGINSKSTVHQSTPRQASIRKKKKGPLLGKVQVKILHQRSPYAVKFEDRSQEETERPQRCAQSKAWNRAKNIYKLKEKDKATFYSPSEEWVFPVQSTKEPEERELVVDSGTSMHVVSKTLTLPSWRP